MIEILLPNCFLLIAWKELNCFVLAPILQGLLLHRGAFLNGMEKR